jgi:large subunit ribosomal protein L4
MKANILNLDNKAAGDVELSDAIFGLEPRADLIQRVVVWQLAKRRSGQHKVLTRAEVNRTKKKMYKQKGTGQARHGARSAPLFVGGAKAMGPVSHSHEFDLPKKVKALGLRHALSSKAKAGSIVILDEAKSKDVKTGALAKQFGNMNLGRALVVDGEFDKNFQLSARNLSNVALLPVTGINVYDIMRSDKLVLTTAAVKAIEARFGEGSGLGEGSAA